MQVFISHASADQHLADELARDLQSAGVRVWSPLDTILPGDNWELEVGKALEESDVMVALFSRDTKDSSTVRHVQYALTSGNYRGRIIPVLIDFVTFQAGVEVPWVLLHMTPVYLNRAAPDFSPIVERVRKIASAEFHASA